MKKSYNPFKMWGSWVGFGIGVCSLLLYTGEPSILRDLFGTPFVAINPLIWIVRWPIPSIVLTTPIMTFVYGWGIHSIFRKLSSR